MFPQHHQFQPTFQPPVLTQVALPWMVLDIETGPASEDAIQQELEYWKPAGNVSKPETIEKQRAEAQEKIRERSALLDSAPVIAIAVHSPLETRVFHSLQVSTLTNILNTSAPGEAEMLLLFRQYVDLWVTPGTLIIGHNLAFDLPHIRFACVRNGLRLPVFLHPENDHPTCDTMRLWQRFTTKDSPFIRLDEISKRLKLANGKTFSGKDIPVLYTVGRHAEIVEYAANDVRLTAQVWEKLTGQTGI